MTSEVKKQKTDDIQTTSLVWLDDTAETSEENVSAQQHLRIFDTNLKIFKNDNECEQYLQSQSSHNHIVFIVIGKLGQNIVSRVHDFPQIVSIYVFCWNKSLHEEWANKYSKVFENFIRFYKLIV
jgi:hypothetical protein